MGLLLRIVINAAALWVAALIIPGISLTGADTTSTVVNALLVALVFGVLNALIKPLFIILGLPVIAVTLGLFLLVINALMLMLTSWVSGLLGLPFSVDGFLSAFAGGIVVAVIAWIAGTTMTSERR